MDLQLSLKRGVFTVTQEYLLEGKYRILKKLGQGAFGEVFLTEHAGLGVLRAIKRIRKNQDKLQTGRNEVDILKNLLHPGLPIIYDVWEDTDFLYIVEEYVKGKSLREYVSEKSHLSERQTIQLGIDITTILNYMQENGGICHLDLKPENIIVSNGAIKLLDFGSGVFGGKAKRYITGTQGYAAPELYHMGSLDGVSDIYSVGMLMRYMLTGKEQFSSNIQCSDNLKLIINKCCSHYKGERYQSAQALGNALQQLINEKTTTKNPVVINVYGSQKRIGTTHFSIMLASYLTARKKKALLILSANRSTMPFYSSLNHIHYSGGVYRINGIAVVPDYADCAQVVCEEDFGIIIRDCGLYNGRSIDEKAVNVLVCGHMLDELLQYERAAEHMKQTGLITAVNFTDGYEFYRLKKEQHIKAAIRIPYCVRPFSFRGERCGFEKILSLCQAEKTVYFRRLLRFTERVWQHSSGFVRSQLSGKRSRQKNSGS